jgi:hypothetical protein
VTLGSEIALGRDPRYAQYFRYREGRRVMSSSMRLTSERPARGPGISDGYPEGGLGGGLPQREAVQLEGSPDCGLRGVRDQLL